jgi:hypothetical protein
MGMNAIPVDVTVFKIAVSDTVGKLGSTPRHPRLLRLMKKGKRKRGREVGRRMSSEFIEG